MSSPSKNIFWLSLSRIISLILLFLAYLFLTSYLGPYRYGQFQFVLSYSTLFGVMVDFGLQQYIIKKISEDKSQAKKYFHNFLVVEIVLASLLYVVMVAVAYYNNYDREVIHAIIVSGLGMTLTGLTYPFLSVVTAFYDLKKAAILNFLSSFINFLIILLTIWLHGGIVMLVTQQVVYAIVALIIYYFLIQKHIGKPEILRGLFSLDSKIVKGIIKYGPPFALLAGFATLYNRIDVVLIKHFYDYSQVGLYSAAYKIFDLLAFFPAVVAYALYPLFASLMAEKKIGEVRDIIEKYLRMMTAIALPMAVGGMLLSNQLMGILDARFSNAAPVLSIVVWAPAVLYIYVVANSLVISQLTKWAVVITATNVLINIIGNIILLPHYGIKGAAVMTVVSETFQAIFYFYFVRTKVTNFKFFSLVWRPVLGAIVMGVVVWYFRAWPLVPAVVLGVVVYGAALLALRFFQKDDIAFVKSFLKRGTA